MSGETTPLMEEHWFDDDGVVPNNPRVPLVVYRGVLESGPGAAAAWSSTAVDPESDVAFVEKNWLEDPWSRGCYVGVMGPGTMTAYGSALREPCGRIHWAGTETATEWMGYIEGAIQSGRRAADEVPQPAGAQGAALPGQGQSGHLAVHERRPQPR